MSLTINLTPAEENRLKEAAKERGIPVEEMARRLVREGLPATDRFAEMNRRIAVWQVLDDTPPPIFQSSGAAPSATSQLFAQWAHEDAAMTAEEIAADDRFWDDFRAGIDEARSSAGVRKLF